MDGKPSGVRKVMSTPSLRAFAASDVKVRTTPLTWGCHASVAMRTRIRGGAGCRSVERIELCKHHQLMSQPYDDAASRTDPARARNGTRRLPDTDSSQGVAGGCNTAVAE